MSTTRTRIRYLVALAMALAGALAAPPAGAAPSGSDAAFRLPARSFAELRQEVAQARAADPRSFATVSDVVALAPAAHARARARRAPVALYLAKLGPSALLPMLEMLALDPPRGLPADSAPVLRRDLIEAVGLLRDPRALPVLSAILDDDSEDEETTRTTTEAVARVGTAEAGARLVAALGTSRDARARAILAGMGECRRIEVTEAIGERLRNAADAATARVAARSLGRAGSAWVWQTLADRTGEARIRETAARALVAAFVRQSGEARAAAANALLVVDAPVTRALLEEARKGAPPDTQKALDALAARLARSPIHAR